MKNAIYLFIILLSYAHSAQGQLELVAELDFPERAILRLSEFDRFRYAMDGDWHIVSSLIAGKRQGRAYNVATGELKNTNYIVENPWIFESGRIYAGWDVSSSNSGWVYLNWNDNGTFVQRPPLQGFPELINGDQAYGHKWPGRDVYEMQPFDGLNRVLFNIPEHVAINHLEYDLVDQILYIAHRTGLLVYNLGTDSLSTPFDAYIEEHELEYIPWTCQDGRFLFRPAALENSFEVHEMGHGMAPRIIPQGNNPPDFNPLLWTDNFGDRVSGFHKEKAVSKTDSVTWLGYLTDAVTSPGTTRIIRIDRSLSQPEVDESAAYLGKVRVDYAASPVVYSLTNEKAVSLGMYGEAGIEPYGIQNGAAVLLKDFYEGPRASVGYAYTHDLNMTGRFQRMAVFNDRVFFPVNASWFGMELALSDGTPDGTRLIADLEPGLKGIRAVEFYPTDTHLHFMVQKDDFSMAIYKLGNELPEEPEIPEPDPDADWELLLANDDNARNRWVWHNPDIQTAIVLKDSILTYLSDRHDPPIVPYGVDILRLSLTQIDAHTGAVIRQKLFDGLWLEEDESAQLLARPDGGYTVLRLGRPYYADEDREEEWPYSFGINEALSMISFDADLNFIDLKRLTGNIPDKRFESIIASHAFEQGFIILVKEQNRDYHLLRFDHEGMFLNHVTIERMNAVYEVMEMHFEEETGYLQLINYIRRANCSDCEVRILRYDLNLAVKELWSASYSGYLSHPRLHDTGEGVQWVVGALDGSISLPENNDEKYVSSEGLGKWKIFAASRIKRFNLSQEFITFDVQPLEYYPSFMHEGNIFLHYMRPDLGAEVFEYENYFENYFCVPDRLFYEFSQLNSRGEMAAFHELEMEVAIPDNKTFHTSFITPEGKWIRGIRAGSSNVSHVDLWKEPRPSYHVSLANRFQLFQTDWPFTPLPTEVIASVANDEGSHMAIFPNPNSGSFFLVPRDGANQIPYDRFYTYDMQGRLVFERKLQQDFIYKEIQMPASLAEGVYHVVFTGVDVQESLRLVLVK
jgi:ELWxxDGT repeat protein